MLGELEKAGQCGSGGKEKEGADRGAEDYRVFSLTGLEYTTILDSGAWYSTVCEGGCRFMAALVREEENTSENRLRKREAEEQGKVEVPLGATV